MSNESHCVPGAFPLLSLVRMGMNLSGWNCILGLLFVVCLVVRCVSLLWHCRLREGGWRLWRMWMLFSSTWATGVCFVSLVLAVLKLSQFAAICAEFCMEVCVFVMSRGALLCVFLLESYNDLISPCMNWFSRCLMSRLVDILSESGFGASISCSNKMTSSHMGVGSKSRDFWSWISDAGLFASLHIANNLLNVSSTSSASLNVKLLWLIRDCRKVGIDGLRLCSHDSVFDQLLDVCSVSFGDNVLSNSLLVLFLYLTWSLDKWFVSAFSVQNDLLHCRHIKMDAHDNVWSLSVWRLSAWCVRKCCLNIVWELNPNPPLQRCCWHVLKGHWWLVRRLNFNLFWSADWRCRCCGQLRC